MVVQGFSAKDDGRNGAWLRSSEELVAAALKLVAGCSARTMARLQAFAASRGTSAATHHHSKASSTASGVAGKVAANGGDAAAASMAAAPSLGSVLGRVPIAAGASSMAPLHPAGPARSSVRSSGRRGSGDCIGTMVAVDAASRRGTDASAAVAAAVASGSGLSVHTPRTSGSSVHTPRDSSPTGAGSAPSSASPSVSLASAHELGGDACAAHEERASSRGAQQGHGASASSASVPLALSQLTHARRLSAAAGMMSPAVLLPSGGKRPAASANATAGSADAAAVPRVLDRGGGGSAPAYFDASAMPTVHTRSTSLAGVRSTTDTEVAPPERQTNPALLRLRLPFDPCSPSSAAATPARRTSGTAVVGSRASPAYATGGTATHERRAPAYNRRLTPPSGGPLFVEGLLSTAYGRTAHISPLSVASSASSVAARDDSGPSVAAGLDAPASRGPRLARPHEPPEAPAVLLPLEASCSSGVLPAISRSMPMRDDTLVARAREAGSDAAAAVQRAADAIGVISARSARTAVDALAAANTSANALAAARAAFLPAAVPAPPPHLGSLTPSHAVRRASSQAATVPDLQSVAAMAITAARALAAGAVSNYGASARVTPSKSLPLPGPARHAPSAHREGVVAANSSGHYASMTRSSIARRTSLTSGSAAASGGAGTGGDVRQHRSRSSDPSGHAQGGIDVGGLGLLTDLRGSLRARSVEGRPARVTKPSTTSARISF